MEAPEFPGIESPYDKARRQSQAKQYFPQLETLDNGNVIIMFENSKSERPFDTLIAARVSGFWRDSSAIWLFQRNDMMSWQVDTFSCADFTTSNRFLE